MALLLLLLPPARLFLVVVIVVVVVSFFYTFRTSLIGRIEEERGRFDGALRAYREALRRDGAMAEAHAGEASVLFKLRRYSQATASAETALRHDPGNAEARRILDQAQRGAAGRWGAGSLSSG